MSSVLVIGASGYIGFAVAQYLRQKGYTVYGIVRKHEQGKQLAQNEIHPVVGDGLKPEGFESVIKQVKIIIETSSDPTVHQAILGLVKKHSTPQNKKVYIFTSGVLVHGDSQKFLDEDQLDPKPQLLQARDKFEQFVVHSPEIYGITLRPGFVYGYWGGKGGNHVNSWFNPEDGKIVILGNKDRTHPWVHIADLAHAYYLTLQHYITASGEIFDIASAAPSEEEIRRKAAAVAGFPHAEIVLKPFPSEDTWGATILNTSQRTSYAKAQSVLGWTPSHPSVVDNLEANYEAWKANKI